MANPILKVILEALFVLKVTSTPAEVLAQLITSGTEGSLDLASVTDWLIVGAKRGLWIRTCVPMTENCTYQFTRDAVIRNPANSVYSAFISETSSGVTSNGVTGTQCRSASGYYSGSLTCNCN